MRRLRGEIHQRNGARFRRGGRAQQFVQFRAQIGKDFRGERAQAFAQLCQAHNFLDRAKERLLSDR